MAIISIKEIMTMRIEYLRVLSLMVASNFLITNIFDCKKEQKVFPGWTAEGVALSHS